MSVDTGGSKQKQSSFQMPRAPAWVEDPTKNLVDAIMGLGQRPSSSFVTGASPLQKAAFGMGTQVAGRYGIDVPQNTPQMGSGTVSTGGGSSSGGGGLFASLGASGQPDYSAYLSGNPDLSTAYQNLSPRDMSNISQVVGDGTGAVTPEQFASFHYNRAGKAEGRQMPTVGAQYGGGSVDTGGGQYRPTNDNRSVAEMGQGVTVGQSPAANPLDNYRDAGLMARLAGNSGANTAQATTYDPAQMSPAQIGLMERISGTGYDPALITEAFEPISAARVKAQSLLTNLDDYMNPYIDDVVTTTLAGFDENTGRLQAQQAAQAAANNAFGGSRYAVQEAVTQGEIARERAASEAGLRSDAFNTGASLSADDANRRQAAAARNAELRQQAAIASRQSEITRLLSNMGAQNDAARFGAETGFQADQFNANNANNRELAQAGYEQQANLANQDALNQAGQFNASSQNNMAQFNANQQDTALERQLAASGLLSQIANTQQGNERADMGLLAELGGVQRDIQRSADQADVQSLSAITQLLSQLGLSDYIGSSGTGQVKVKNSSNLLGSALNSAVSGAGDGLGALLFA